MDAGAIKNRPEIKNETQNETRKMFVIKSLSFFFCRLALSLFTFWFNIVWGFEFFIMMISFSFHLETVMSAKYEITLSFLAGKNCEKLRIFQFKSNYNGAVSGAALSSAYKWDGFYSFETSCNETFLVKRLKLEPYVNMRIHKNCFSFFGRSDDKKINENKCDRHMLFLSGDSQKKKFCAVVKISAKS